MKRKFVQLSTVLLTITLAFSLSNLGLGNSNKIISAAKLTTLKNNKLSQSATNLSAKQIGGFGYRTTGGSSANCKVFTVTSTNQLRRALNSKTEASRIIIIKASLDGNDGLSESDYASGTGYDFNQYLNVYNPSTYGKKEPAGIQENARSKAEQNQKKHVVFDVPSNTSIIGSSGVTLSNINFMVHGNNVIFSHLSMVAPVDDFPQWNPNDGSTGNWNSQYDAISLKGATNVWIDHSKFYDGHTNDAKTTEYYNRQYQHHDGLVDITDASDKVTVSNNVFANHDKTMLIGSSDSDTSDRGKLHVSILDNYFFNNTQRTPRVRYGTVEVINNYFKNQNKSPYQFGYAVGAGYQATILVSHNVANLTKNADHFIRTEDGGHSKVSQSDNLINGALDNNKKNVTLSHTNINLISTSQVKRHVIKNAGPK